MATLENILEGKEEVVEQPVEEEKPVEEVTEEPATGEEEKATEETEEVEEVEEVTPPVTEEKSKEVPIQAMLDERDKRKEAQLRAEALQAEIDKLKETNQEKPDFWENPDAALQALRNEVIEKEIKPLQDQMTSAYIDLSRQMTRSFVGDAEYDAAEKAFADAAKQNPLLVQQALESGNPGKYMYDTGKQFNAIDSAGGDLDSLKAQWRQEWEAEQKSKLEKKDSKLKSVPESLTETPSAHVPGEKVEGGPTPLENILRSD